MISMSRDEFWNYIEQCHRNTNGMPAFNRFLEALLDAWSFHNGLPSIK